MRRQHWHALGPGSEGGWPREGGSFYQQFGEDRPLDEPPSVAPGQAFPMDPDRQFPNT